MLGAWSVLRKPPSKPSYTQDMGACICALVCVCVCVYVCMCVYVCVHVCFFFSHDCFPPVCFHVFRLLSHPVWGGEREEQEDARTPSC